MEWLAGRILMNSRKYTKKSQTTSRTYSYEPLNHKYTSHLD